MLKRSVGLLFAAALVVGVGAVPASASGCPEVGQAWSAWAQLGPEGEDSTGTWTARVASTQTTDYDVAAGPGVISRVVSSYCD